MVLMKIYLLIDSLDDKSALLDVYSKILRESDDAYSKVILYLIIFLRL